MKRVYLLASVLIGTGLCGMAQLVSVKSVEKVTLPEDMLVEQAVISPDGQYAVVSSLTDQSLKRINLANGDMLKVTDNGSMLDLKISDDSETVVFRQRTTDKKRLSQTSIQAMNLRTGKATQIVAPSRSLSGFVLNNDVVNTIQNGRAKAKGLNGSKSVSMPVVGIYRGHLNVSQDGNTTTLDPQGRGSYLWPSLSPDGTKIVYYLSQKGCFVCNLDGSDVKSLGYIHAPKWLDNNTIVGMQDFDNGTVTTASSLMVSNLDGTTQTITNADVIAMYPSVSADGKHIAFTDNAGAMYILTIE